MRLVGVTSILVLVCSLPALAAEMPARKPGLWEIKVSSENRAAAGQAGGQTIQQCTDAATDQALQSSAGPAAAQRNCSKRDVSKSGDTVTIDSTCTVNGRTSTSHVVMPGNFTRDYTMTITSQVEGGRAAPRTTTMSAKWLGACAADQKPGDMILAGGRKININSLRGGVPPGTPEGRTRQRRHGSGTRSGLRHGPPRFSLPVFGAGGALVRAGWGAAKRHGRKAPPDLA